MHDIVYIIIGILLSIIIIKLLIPIPKEILIIPTHNNYDDLKYVDDEGKIYKYDMVSVS